MKKAYVALFVLIVFFATSAPAADGFPTGLAGFTLGADVQQYAALCDLDKAIPVSDAPFLSEATLKTDSLPGVRGGSLGFGNCKAVDKLVRVKLKFYQMDQELFDRLHAKYLSKFGKPDRYLGDAFKNVIAWEWLFKNGRSEEISVVLMWSRDKEIRPGVSIKMTNNTLMEGEFECYKAASEPGKHKKRTKVKSLDMYMPR